MDRYHDGAKLLEEVNSALEEALRKHGVQLYSLLGLTTVLEAIASPLKLHHLQGIGGREMGRLGQKAYEASIIPRRVALLQSPHSETVNPMMESVVVVLQRAKAPLNESDLRLEAYRVFLSRPRASIASAEKTNSSLASAFSSAISYLNEGQVISRTETGVWQLND